MKPTLCSKCRYDLSGLPGVGNCPECGQRYWITRGKGIYHGDSAEARGGRIVRRLRTIIFLVLGMIVLVAGTIVQLATKRQNAFLTGLGVGGLLLVVAYMSYATEKEEE